MCTQMHRISRDSYLANRPNSRPKLMPSKRSYREGTSMHAAQHEPLHTCRTEEEGRSRARLRRDIAYLTRFGSERVVVCDEHTQQRVSGCAGERCICSIRCFRPKRHSTCRQCSPCFRKTLRSSCLSRWRRYDSGGTSPSGDAAWGSSATVAGLQPTPYSGGKRYHTRD